MGYYITAHGHVTIPRSLESEALNALKMLNYDHEAKRGGVLGNPNATFETRWYSWMPERWHEDVASIGDVLELVGFEVGAARQAGLMVYTLDYDNKTGQEEVFLNCLADYAQVDVEFTGEDGLRWRWANAKAGAPLVNFDGEVVYKENGTVAEIIRRHAELWEKSRRMYA